MILLIIVCFLFSQTLAAQGPDSSIHSDTHKNEIGIANSPVYLLKEKEFAYGLHAHYIRGLKETKFGIGIGYERIFDEHNHNTIGVILSYAPLEHLALSLSPGITFPDNDANLNFGIHLETLYEFEIGIFHVGPVAEFAYAVEDYHVSLGLHFGFGF
jgi:hypothetical protein